MTKKGNGLDSVADQSVKVWFTIVLFCLKKAVSNLNGCSSDLVQTLLYIGYLKICSLFPRLQLTPDFRVDPGRDKC